jgi:hypothetical protein
MEAAKQQLPAADNNAKTVDGHSSASVDTTSSRKLESDIPPELTSDNVMPLIQKIAAGSIAEIEKVIVELQATRSFLQSEGERIHQETVRFAQLNRTATASVKIISESISEWLQSGGHARSKVAV